MKKKTKILSVLGIAAIATTSLSSIAACTFRRDEPDVDEYAPPKVSATVTTGVTESGSPTCVIPNFKFDRSLYFGEGVQVTFSQSVNSNVNVKNVVVNMEHSDGASADVKVTLDVDEGSTEQGLKSTFKLAFIFTYQGKSMTVPLGNDFIVSYTPAYVANSVKYNGQTEEDKTFDFEERGNSVLVINEESYSGEMLFSLTEALTVGERVRVESSNAFVNAEVMTMATGDTNIPIKLSIVNYTQQTELRPKINLKFTISKNSEIVYSKTYSDFQVIYKPKGKAISITNEGKTLSFFPNERGGREISMSRYFHLSRLLNESTNEQVKITLLDPKDPSNALPFDWSYQLVDYRYYTFNIRYTGLEDYTNKTIPFLIHFDIFDSIGGEGQPIYQETFPKQGEGAEEVERYFTFNYTAPWEENDADWVGKAEDKTIVTQEGNPSASLGNGNSHIELTNLLKTGIEDLNIELISSNNILSLDSWSFIDDNNKGLILNNITLNDLSIENDPIPFKVKISFLENGEVQKIVTLEGFNFTYTAPVASLDVFVPNGQTEAGKVSLTMTATAAEPIDKQYTVNVSSMKEKVAVAQEAIISEDRLHLTLNVTLTVEDLFAKDILFENVQFQFTLMNGSQEEGTATSNNFNITFKHGEIPWEEPEENYMEDRSFSFVCYNKNNPIPYTQTAFILAKYVAGSKYEYYIATTWTYKRQWESVKNSSGDNFVFGISDSSLHKEYMYSTTQGGELKNKVEGSKYDVDYITFDQPKTAITWESESLFKDVYNTRYQMLFCDQHSGSSDIFVGRMNFQNIIDKEQSTYHTNFIQQKLDYLNAWRENKTESGGHINNFVSKAVIQTESDASYNNFYCAGYPVYNYYFDKTDTKTTAISVWDNESYYCDKAVAPGATRYYNRQKFFPYYYNTSQRSFSHKHFATGEEKFLGGEMYHISPAYYTMEGDAATSSDFWYGQKLEDLYMSPGSMMLARNRKTNQVYLLGVYVGYLTLTGSHKSQSDRDLAGAHYMPWFDSYINADDEKWSDKTGLKNIFAEYIKQEA